jgi:DNA-binding NtrC family response regulator
MLNMNKEFIVMSYNTDISLLLVENDPTCLEMCQKIIAMRFKKMLIHTATNQAEAIVKYKDHKHEIVITDIFGQSKNGLIIAQKVCEINPTAIVIFISADTDIKWETLKPKAKKLCLEGVIHKPIDINELINKIKEAVSILKNNSNQNN